METCVSVFLSLPALARPGNPRQDLGDRPDATAPQDEKQKTGTSPGKDVGKGGEDVGKMHSQGGGKLWAAHCRSGRQSRYFAP